MYLSWRNNLTSSQLLFSCVDEVCLFQVKGDVVRNHRLVSARHWSVWYYDASLNELATNVWIAEYQTCQPPKHVNLQILKKKVKKILWYWDLKLGDFQYMHLMKIKIADFLFQGIRDLIFAPYCIFCCLFGEAEALRVSQPPFWVQCSQLKLSWHTYVAWNCTQDSLKH